MGVHDRGRRAENVRRILQLCEEGLTPKEIAERVGLTASTVRNYLKDPTGEYDRARKESYRGTCEVCGKRTTGSDGPRKAPTRCDDHKPTAPPKWTRERVIEAIRAWAITYGEPPGVVDWNPYTAKNGLHDPERAARFLRLHAGGKVPWYSAVYRAFGSWGAALEAAGFDARVPTGSKENARRRRPQPKRTHCKRNHKLAPGERACARCRNERQRLRRIRKRAAERGILLG